MPNMCNRTYQDFHNTMYMHMNTIALNEMQLAGQEEKRLAIENGQVDHLGRPKIAVVADGAWSKRSYKTKYNALSGVACIIGAKTKKVIFCGVRNKYCCICQLPENRDEIAQDHVCFKNWNSASTAMEADIIVEGFKQSLHMHNVIYSQLIGDGDSSIMKRLRLEKPYGTNVVIKKVECTNHLLRNYINRLRDISGKRKNDKGDVIRGCYRKVVHDRLLRLRYAVTEAIKYRRLEQTDRTYEATLTLLKADITNGPNHVFGDHTKCQSYFCEGQKKGM
ncbi:unnamed protein product [Macrosiphum euphorbiae]|uniref:Mutator-like transposase domain-containing protein n=2 Tax=Macrosiphum euphorbiae TaxID=13131 RepID=A0AAV0Y8W3_9HEMI|nr:unnamed protein product [Macrosiphum euphorbiae]